MMNFCASRGELRKTFDAALVSDLYEIKGLRNFLKLKAPSGRSWHLFCSNIFSAAAMSLLDLKAPFRICQPPSRRRQGPLLRSFQCSGRGS